MSDLSYSLLRDFRTGDGRGAAMKFTSAARSEAPLAGMAGSHPSPPAAYGGKSRTAGPTDGLVGTHGISTANAQWAGSAEKMRCKLRWLWGLDLNQRL